MKEIQDSIIDRDNFKPMPSMWCCSRVGRAFVCYSSQEERAQRLFEKGMKRIQKDIDLRAIIKSTRNV